MNANLPHQAAPSAGNQPGTPTPKRRSWVLYFLAAMLGLFLVMCGTVAFTIWYIQRPIKPVELSIAEKTVVETKLDRLSTPPPKSTLAPAPESSRTTLELDRPYEAGSKALRLTERELNGLLNANTDLGKTVRLELGQDAINAYVTTPIPQDVPLVGGKMFRARGRFRVSLGTNGAAPFAILEDVTIFGLSLPKEWLG